MSAGSKLCHVLGEAGAAPADVLMVEGVGLPCRVGLPFLLSEFSYAEE